MTHEYLSMRSGNASNCMNLACESRRLCRILFTLPSNRRHRVIGSIPEEELVGGGREKTQIFCLFPMLVSCYIFNIFHFRNEQKTGRNYFEQLPVSFYLNYRRVSTW